MIMIAEKVKWLLHLQLKLSFCSYPAVQAGPQIQAWDQAGEETETAGSCWTEGCWKGRRAHQEATSPPCRWVFLKCLFLKNIERYNSFLSYELLICIWHLSQSVVLSHFDSKASLCPRHCSKALPSKLKCTFGHLFSVWLFCLLMNNISSHWGLVESGWSPLVENQCWILFFLIGTLVVSQVWTQWPH